MYDENSFYSIDRLVEFGMSMAIAQQMVQSMNQRNGKHQGNISAVLYRPAGGTPAVQLQRGKTGAIHHYHRHSAVGLCICYAIIRALK